MMIELIHLMKEKHRELVAKQGKQETKDFISKGNPVQVLPQRSGPVYSLTASDNNNNNRQYQQQQEEPRE